MKKMISVCLLFVLLLAGSLWIDQTMRSSEKTKPEEVAEEMAADTEKLRQETVSQINELKKSEKLKKLELEQLKAGGS